MWLILNLLFITCQQIYSMGDLHFLEGTWKVEGKEQYEIWEIDDNGLSGCMYIITPSGKEKQEILTIKTIENQIVYEATVPDQNEGKTIRFTLNREIKNYFSFENSEHDFPKKIQYEYLNENKLVVRVMGDENNDFVLTYIRQ